MSIPEDLRDEQIRMTRLRVMADLTAHWLKHGRLSRQEGLQLIEDVREAALQLCPDKGDAFDLILRPRFLRILNERALTEWGVTDSFN